MIHTTMIVLIFVPFALWWGQVESMGMRERSKQQNNYKISNSRKMKGRSQNIKLGKHVEHKISYIMKI